jgi:hypothetical protein
MTPRKLEALCKELHNLKVKHKLDAIAQSPAFPAYKTGHPPKTVTWERTPTPKIFRLRYPNDPAPRYAFRIILCGEKTYLIYSEYATALYALNNYKQALPKGYTDGINELARLIQEQIKCLQNI